MDYDNFFPLGLAIGRAFLGREQDQAKLIRNIQAARHTLLLSPRKYGKTSLVKNVIYELKCPATDIDLFLAATTESIQGKILTGCRQLINQVAKKPEKWLTVLAEYFRTTNKHWSVGIKGLSLEFSPESNDDVAQNILDALRSTEHILSKKKQIALLFIDEAQEIAKVEHNITIEGAIRHFAQESKYLVLIFSGSNRHMLAHMFSDNVRPLYDLCEQLKLERISPDLYREYFDYVAMQTWNKPLDSQVSTRIIEISQCHPKTVYLLSKQVWDHAQFNNRMPIQTDVDTVWDAYIDLKLKDTRYLLKNRSVSQIKLLTTIAIGDNRELSGKKFQQKFNLTSSAIIQSLSLLEQDDMIERIPDSCFRIIDPVIAATLERYNRDYL